MNNITHITTLLNLYMLKKEINESCIDLDFNEYSRLKEQKKKYDSLKCNDQQNQLNDDLLNNIKKYNLQQNCINKYDLLQFYTKLNQF